MLLFLLKTVVVLAVVLTILGLGRTFQVEHSANQTRFLAGTLPSPAPDGFYKGSVGSFHVPWIGKKFDAEHASGINVFDTGSSTQAEKYPFKTYEGKGLTDQWFSVLKIDYDVPENPWWMHPVLDEIVQVGPDQYLGKLHVRIFSFLSFTLGFFELQK